MKNYVDSQNLIFNASNNNSLLAANTTIMQILNNGSYYNTLSWSNIINGTIWSWVMNGSVLKTSQWNATNSSYLLGTGTAGYIPMWNGTNSLNNSAIYQNGTMIGIGITNPLTTLHISDASNEAMRIEGAGSASWLTFFNGATVESYFGYGTSGSLFTGAGVNSTSLRAENDLHLGAGGNNLIMTLNGTSKNVGIGTTAPRTQLDVPGLGTELFIGGSAKTNVAVVGNTRRLNYVDVMFARNLGGVTGNDSYRTIGTTSAGGYAGIEFKYGGDVAIYGFYGSATEDQIVTPTPRIWVNGSTGNVGIGTTSPQNKLNVIGSVNATQSIIFGSTNMTTKANGDVDIW
jgi:hypothetical protein